MANVSIPKVRTRKQRALTAGFFYRHPDSRKIKTHKSVRNLIDLQKERVQKLEEAYAKLDLDANMDRFLDGEMSEREARQYISQISRYREQVGRVMEKESRVPLAAMTAEQTKEWGLRLHYLKGKVGQLGKLIDALDNELEKVA